MTKRLIIMRHAHSDCCKGQKDHARPLNKEGRHAASMLGRWLRNGGYLLDQVISSTAVRTLETYERLNTQAALHATPDLYLASADKIYQVLQRATGKTVLILGHNPGISAFAQQMVKPQPAHPHFANYPSGAMLLTEFACVDWQQVTWKSGQAQEFVIPADLDPSPKSG